jgi:predicted dehydrogenase
LVSLRSRLVGSLTTLKCEPVLGLTRILHKSFLVFDFSSGAEGPGGAEFTAWKTDTEKKYGVGFLSAVADLPALPEGVKRLALISGRTADNPKLLTQCIANGCTTIYLEKPGAPTVGELRTMRDEAKAAGVTVLMGYNKNVCKYVSKARDYQKEKGGTITFVSNNTYENTPASLGECFERNREGMLKNMVVHELALLVSFFDVTVENIESCVADKEFSSCQTLKGPSGSDFTDFDKIKFTIKTKTGKEVTVVGDRCGGDVSWASVEEEGKEVFRHSMPDEEDKAGVTALEAEYPGAMPYFFSQDPDYITVKERVAAQCATGVEADGVATLDVAVETLRVAEYLTPTLTEQLL